MEGTDLIIAPFISPSGMSISGSVEIESMFTPQMYQTQKISSELPPNNLKPKCINCERYVNYENLYLKEQFQILKDYFLNLQRELIEQHEKEKLQFKQTLKDKCLEIEVLQKKIKMMNFKISGLASNETTSYGHINSMREPLSITNESYVYQDFPPKTSQRNDLESDMDYSSRQQVESEEVIQSYQNQAAFEDEYLSSYYQSEDVPEDEIQEYDMVETPMAQTIATPIGPTHLSVISERPSDYIQGTPLLTNNSRFLAVKDQSNINQFTTSGDEINEEFSYYKYGSQLNKNSLEIEQENTYSPETSHFSENNRPSSRDKVKNQQRQLTTQIHYAFETTLMDTLDRTQNNLNDAFKEVSRYYKFTESDQTIDKKH